MNSQLPLGLQLHAAARFDNYWPGPNRAAVAAVEACARGEEPSLLFLWGPQGSGRSHLLQAACHEAAAHGGSVAYLPLGAQGMSSPQMLQGLEQASLVCIDDIDAAAGLPEWERALFGLCNGLLERRARLAVTAAAPPGECGIQLADLVSRLSLSAVFRLQPLDDEQKLAVLQVRAGAKGLGLNEEVGRYLLRHYRRDLPGLFALLERLDRESLAAQRRLTVPFVREVLAREQAGE